jgi:hypothetical protein
MPAEFEAGDREGDFDICLRGKLVLDERHPEGDEDPPGVEAEEGGWKEKGHESDLTRRRVELASVVLRVFAPPEGKRKKARRHDAHEDGVGPIVFPVRGEPHKMLGMKRLEDVFDKEWDRQNQKDGQNNLREPIARPPGRFGRFRPIRTRAEHLVTHANPPLFQN